MLSSFSMPSEGSAPDRVAAILMVHGSALQPQWSDVGDRTVITITHEDSRLEPLTQLILKAHPKVRYVSSRAA